MDEVPVRGAKGGQRGHRVPRLLGGIPVLKETTVMRHSKPKGFSLIELLIVVAIILIIAAIAIPNLLRARMAANESSAVASIRTINTGQVTYNSSYPTVGYATALTNLGGVAPCTPVAATACLIDSVLAAGTKSGYKFAATAAGGPPSTQYYATATPVTPNQTG